MKEMSEFLLSCISLKDHKKLETVIKKRGTHLDMTMVTDEEGNSFISNAVKVGDHISLMILLQNGYDANIPNNNGDTPLHISIKF